MFPCPVIVIRDDADIQRALTRTRPYIATFVTPASSLLAVESDTAGDACQSPAGDLRSEP